MSPSDSGFDRIRCPACGKQNPALNPRCTACGEALPLDSGPTLQPMPPAASVHWPEGLIVGQYQLQQRLGHGGMGVVYRALDPTTGRTIALKSLQALEATLMPALRREIRALSGLRHPSIVQILDSGVHKGIPWYAMELIEGPSLREFRPTDLATLCLWLEQLCDALAYLHGEGLVHRDLKPDNILMRSEEREARSEERQERSETRDARREKNKTRRTERQAARGIPATAPSPSLLGSPTFSPVLVDFGLSSAFSGNRGRESLVLQNGTSGTVAYMAPEQWKSDPVDARVDLYALGCVLYELLTGTPPFSGSAAQIAQAHLEQPPPRPSQRIAGLDPALDQLVQSLMAKDPRQRLGHADAVAAALARIRGSAPIQATAPRPKPYLYRPGFAGRSQVLATLRSRLSGTAPGVCLLAGESGAGKTRLLLELAQVAHHQGMHILTGGCLDGAVVPLQALLEPLQNLADRCRAEGSQRTVQLLGEVAGVLAPYQPAFRDLTGLEDRPQPIELPPAAARNRLFLALQQTFGQLAKDQPLLLLLDDLQWADELTLGWLATQTAATSEGLVVIGAYREEEISPALQRLLALPHVQGVSLGRLPEQDVAALVGDMLAMPQPPPGFSQALARHSEGNPFFVAEYLRAAVEEGILERDLTGHWQLRSTEIEATTDRLVLPLPSALRDLVGRRLIGLPAQALALCQAASVLGRNPDLDLLTRITGLTEASLDQTLHELLRRQVLESAGPGQLRFLHDKIREVAYDALQPPARQDWHRAAAQAIETAVDTAPDRAAQLTRHWEEAGHPDKACPYALLAARQLRQQNALHEADRFYQAYFRLAEGRNHDTGPVRTEYSAIVLTFLGRTQEALAQAQQALAEAREHQDVRAEIAAIEYVAKVLRRLGRIEEGIELQQQGLAAAVDLGDRKLQGRALQNLGYLQLDADRNRAAQHSFEHALACHIETGNRQQEGIVRNGLGSLYWKYGDREATARFYREAIALAQQTGDLLNQSYSLSNLGSVHTVLRQFPEAHAAYREALALNRRLGDEANEASTLINLANLQGEEGAWEEARQNFQRALALKRKANHRIATAVAAMGLANMQRLLGDYPPALALLDEAEAILRELGHSSFTLEAQRERLRLLLAWHGPQPEILQQLRQVLEQSAHELNSELLDSIARLRKTVEAIEAGQLDRLVRGELLEDQPSASMQRLRSVRDQQRAAAPADQQATGKSTGTPADQPATGKRTRRKPSGPDSTKPKTPAPGKRSRRKPP